MYTKEKEIVVQETEIQENSGKKTFYIDEIRKDFPILQKFIRKNPLVYLDNAATTQKPRSVIEALEQYYTYDNSNIHRGIHFLSQTATKKYEEARGTIAKFINAVRSPAVIFTRGTTESINLVASTFGRMNVHEGDEVLITHMDHHSGIVPWQMLCEEKGAKLRVVPIDDNGELMFDEYLNMLNEKTKIVSFVHVSNSLGTINPAKDIIDAARDRGIPVMMDAAQSVQHITVDVQELDVDFLAFSGHKVYGPTGIGVLYGKKHLLDEMPPYQGGGDMIKNVTFEKTIYNDLPYKFEGGTPNIAGAIGLGEAIKYIRNIGIDAIRRYEADLLNYATEKLQEIDELKIIGTAKEKSSSISFVLDNIHPHDVGTMLDMDGIAIRTGHHCTQPVMDRFNVPATSRASIAFYNTKSEIDTLVESLKKVINMFGQ